MSDSHSDQQLARSFLPFRRRRGTCEVRGRGADLWYAAAKALGFKVKTIRCQDRVFVGQMSGFCPGLKSLAPYPGRLRRPNRLPDIIFTDSGSFPTGPDSAEYWNSWTTPHLFYDLGVNDGTEGPILGRCGVGSPPVAPTPPAGWTV